MAAIVSADRKKKLLRHANHNSHDRSSGMSASTKRHFDNVKRKIFAFVDQQHNMEVDAIPLPPPPPSPFHHPPRPPPMFGEQKKILKQPLHHFTPAPLRKHLGVPLPPHNQLPAHLALATPQVAHRIRKL
jgi:hypothetical protein